MITLRQQTFVEWLCSFYPPYRRRMDAERRETIRWLIEHPEAPCVIGDKFILNGYGSPISPPDF